MEAAPAPLEDTRGLAKHLAQLCDRLGKGAKLAKAAAT